MTHQRPTRDQNEERGKTSERSVSLSNKWNGERKCERGNGCCSISLTRIHRPRSNTQKHTETNTHRNKHTQKQTHTERNKRTPKHAQIQTEKSHTKHDPSCCPPSSVSSPTLPLNRRHDWNDSFDSSESAKEGSISNQPPSWPFVGACNSDVKYPPSWLGPEPTRLLLS